MSKNKKILIPILICGIVLAIFPFVAGAETVDLSKANPLQKFCPGGKCDPAALVGGVIKAVLGIVGSIALLMFIYGGFLWLTSGGSTEKITKGKNVLTWAAIGLTVIFLSYTLVNFVIQGLTKGGETTTEETTSGQ